MWSVDPLSRLVLFLAFAVVLFIALSFAVVGWGNRAAKRDEKSTKYPTPIMRLRARLGRCSHCWRRSGYRADVQSLNAADEVLGTIPLRLCEKHVDEYMGALTSVPYRGGAAFTDGRRVEWSTDPDDDF